MKNKLLAILLLGVITAFAIYAYNFPPRMVEPVELINKDEVCMDYSNNSISTLKNGLIHDMVNLYRDNQLQSIQGSASRPVSEDAHTIWFNLDTIKKFIYHIEKNVRSNPDTQNSKLGLRIYYAAYPESNLWSSKYENLTDLLGDPITSQYGKKHTLVMLPTILTKDGKIKDINLLDKSTFKNGLTKFENPKENNIMPDVLRNKNIAALFPIPTSNITSTNIDDDISARNHGLLYPPGNPIDAGY